MMRIVILDGSFETTSFIRRLLEGLVKNGHDIHVLGFNDFKRNLIDGVRYHSIGSNDSQLRLIWTSLRLAMKSVSMRVIARTVQFILTKDRQKLQRQNLSHLIGIIEPDIIHLQWPSLIPWFENCLKSGKYKILLSQRGFHINVRPFVDDKNSIYLQEYLPYFSGFHSVSKAISKKGDLLYASSNKIDKVVYTGFDVKTFTFEQAYQIHKKLQIVSVGRSHWKKGYDYALQACSELKNNGVAFTYTIIGAFPDEEQLYLIHQYNLEEEIKFVPKLVQQEVYRRVQKSDVFLLPSLEEGLANVVVESMLLGIPVISTNCGGMDELITHGETGWLVPTYDPKAMAADIIRFSKLSLEEIESIRLAARKKVEEQHSMEQMVTGMEELYQLAINNE